MKTIKRAKPFTSIKQWEFDCEGVKFEFVVNGNDPVFDGHYPGNPILPGIYTLESITQGIELFFKHEKNIKAKLKTVASMRFMSPLFPGNKVIISTHLDTEKQQGTCLVKAQVKTEKRKAASAKLLFNLEKNCD